MSTRPPLKLPQRGVLMVQGTTSDAGKSTLVAGLCRVLANRGIRVAPFKPQNMALNSAVTEDGGEIGRAQALQALACRIPAEVDMNPILLKPTTDQGAQVIVQGKALSQMEAQAYHDYKKVARQAVQDSFHRLRQKYDWIIVEGAGSPAEINLREGDIANMGFAEEADCPVVLIADIDKGGVFAHVVGTLQLLSLSEQARTRGFVINRFRGDFALLKPGLDWLEDYTQKPVYGVLPYLHGLYLDAEDGVNSVIPIGEAPSHRIRVLVPVLPRISNHTDFDPLRLHPQVEFQYIGPETAMPPADLIILPGSKTVIADLAWLRQQGWDRVIRKHLRYGGKVIGICGGFQMLGEQIADPHQIEGSQGYAEGLALLEVCTTLHTQKQLTLQTGTLHLPGQAPVAVRGYEIHAGITNGLALTRPAMTWETRQDGAISPDNHILGTYLHGLFDHPEALAALLSWAGLTEAQTLDVAAIREQQLERLAQCCEEHLDLDALFSPTP